MMSMTVCQQYDLVVRCDGAYQTLPNLTNRFDHGYASVASPSLITKLYQILDPHLQLVRSLPIFTKHYHTVDTLWFYAIMNYIKNKGRVY
jgi:hypothetical protein